MVSHLCNPHFLVLGTGQNSIGAKSAKNELIVSCCSETKPLFTHKKLFSSAARVQRSERYASFHMRTELMLNSRRRDSSRSSKVKNAICHSTLLRGR
ncbi:hypothetical protein TNCV_1184651 [Trichonephila clavipes]|nr:hypothetical protein TNCV_1184651 [Trichonephila clavipes]